MRLALAFHWLHIGDMAEHASPDGESSKSEQFVGFNARELMRLLFIRRLYEQGHFLDDGPTAASNTAKNELE